MANFAERHTHVVLRWHLQVDALPIPNLDSNRDHA
jgi:diketogulonate reductase-like aldo/keto reductase